eukprot:GHVU01117130.1.p1 GENE.GHVU01117130.1~~GHVU01117130.1.p1  ORF type:complete len:596 (+),score=46.82 GHVU01117130.1:249-1790(+)
MADGKEMETFFELGQPPQTTNNMISSFHQQHEANEAIQAEAARLDFLRVDEPLPSVAEYYRSRNLNVNTVPNQMWRECNRLITFVRLSPGSNVSNPSRCYTSEDILTCSTPMAHLDVERNGRASIEHEWGLQVDFANKSIGGGVLQTGCTQEEIMFAASPELLVSQLFLEDLGENEAFMAIGARKLSWTEGYARNFTFTSSVDTRFVLLDPGDLSGFRRLRRVGKCRRLLWDQGLNSTPIALLSLPAVAALEPQNCFNIFGSPEQLQLAYAQVAERSVPTQFVRISRAVVGIDAIPYDRTTSRDPSRQFHPNSIMREFNKVLAAANHPDIGADMDASRRLPFVTGKLKKNRYNNNKRGGSDRHDNCYYVCTPCRLGLKELAEQEDVCTLRDSPPSCCFSLLLVFVMVAGTRTLVGNWGCGAFRGDPQLKAIIQWLACSVARRDIVYLTFKEQRLCGFEELVSHVDRLRVTVGVVWDSLLKVLDSGDVLQLGAFKALVNELQFRFPRRQDRPYQ